MQNSKADKVLLERGAGRQRYSAFVVGALLAASLYMMLQGVQGGVSQLETELPGRQDLIALFADLRLTLGDHVFNNAVVGTGGWMEYTGLGNSDSFQNVVRISPDDLSSIQANLQLLDDRLRARNIVLVLLIAPNKATIYPERLPKEIQKIGATSELDLLASYLKEHGPPVLVDVRRGLKARSQHYRAYYNTDTHWTPMGAHVAYAAIMRAVSGTYPELAPKAFNEFALRRTRPTLHDIPRSMGVTNILEGGFRLAPKVQDVTWVLYNEDRWPMRVSYTGNEDLPSLLMYMDSFGDALLPLMAPEFSRATYILNVSEHRQLLTLQEVYAVKPDVVVVEFAERTIPLLNRFLENFVSESP